MADVNAMGFNPYAQPQAFTNGSDMNAPQFQQGIVCYCLW